MVIAHKSTSEEIGILRKVFERYDTALESYGYTDEEVERMFDGLVSLVEVEHCLPCLIYALPNDGILIDIGA
jgi:hypothetical protein